MDVREERGKAIAETGLVKQTRFNDMLWDVPSQSGNRSYRVNLAGEEPSCNCPDFEEHGKPCKHIFATAYTVVWQNNSDGSTTLTKTLTVSERRTYPQDWKSYNKAQTTEQDKFQELLRDLCAGVEEPAFKFGRPRMPIKDMIFSAVFKTYSTFSGRRFMSDLREAKERGHIGKTPHYNSIFRYLESESLTPVLRELVRQSSLPLSSVEVWRSGWRSCFHSATPLPIPGGLRSSRTRLRFRLAQISAAGIPISIQQPAAVEVNEVLSQCCQSDSTFRRKRAFLLGRQKPKWQVPQGGLENRRYSRFRFEVN